MADSFFGFDTSSSNINDDDGGGGDGSEDEYNALNDETFGFDNNMFDWEVEHEQRAEELESNRRGRMDDSISSQLEASLSQLVLDETDAPLVKSSNVWQHELQPFPIAPSLMPSLKNVCTVEELERQLRPNTGASTNQNMGQSFFQPRFPVILQRPPGLQAPVPLPFAPKQPMNSVINQNHQLNSVGSQLSSSANQLTQNVNQFLQNTGPISQPSNQYLQNSNQMSQNNSMMQNMNQLNQGIQMNHTNSKMMQSNQFNPSNNPMMQNQMGQTNNQMLQMNKMGQSNQLQQNANQLMPNMNSLGQSVNHSLQNQIGQSNPVIPTPIGQPNHLLQNQMGQHVNQLGSNVNTMGQHANQMGPHASQMGQRGNQLGQNNQMMSNGNQFGYNMVNQMNHHMMGQPRMTAPPPGINMPNQNFSSNSGPLNTSQFNSNFRGSTMASNAVEQPNLNPQNSLMNQQYQNQAPLKTQSPQLFNQNQFMKPIQSPMNQSNLPLLNQSVMSQPNQSQPNPTMMNQQNPPIMNQPNLSIMNQPNQSMLNQPNPSMMNAPNPSMMNQPNQSMMNQTNQSSMNQPNHLMMNLQNPSMMNQLNPPMMNQPTQSMLNQQNHPMMNNSNQAIMNPQNQSLMSQSNQQMVNQTMSNQIQNQKPQTQKVWSAVFNNSSQKPNSMDMSIPNLTQLVQSSYAMFNNGFHNASHHPILNNMFNNMNINHPLFQNQRHSGSFNNNNRHLMNGDDGDHNEMKGDVDEYAGFMSQREKQWLINIQMLQLNTGAPYIDDFYYTVFLERQSQKEKEGIKEAHKANQQNHPFYSGGVKQEQHNRSRQNSVRHNSTSEETPQQRTYVPTQFENSLGKIQCCSVTAPRKIIDVDVVQSEASTTTTTTSSTGRQSRAPSVASTTNASEAPLVKRTKQVLLDVEALYLVLLRLEELNDPLAISNALIMKERDEKQKLLDLVQKEAEKRELDESNIFLRNIESVQRKAKPELMKEPIDKRQVVNLAVITNQTSVTKNLLDENKDELINRMFLGLLYEDRMQQFMMVRKGKALLARFCSRVPPSHSRLRMLWSRVLRALPSSARRDDGSLTPLSPQFRRYIQNSTGWPAVLEACLLLTEALDPARTPYALTAPFTMSVICYLIEKAWTLATTADATSNERQWTKFLKTVARALKNTSLKVAKPIQPLSENKLMYHIKLLESRTTIEILQRGKTTSEFADLTKHDVSEQLVKNFC